MQHTTETPVVFYGHWSCPYANRVEFALAERGVPYQTIEVPPGSFRPAGFTLPPEFVAHSPNLTIPLVRVGEHYQSESLAALQFLETLPFPSLLPAHEEQDILSRVAWLDQTLMPPAGGFLFGREQALRSAAAEQLSSALERVGQQLSGSDWLVGDRPSMAEAIVAPLYVRLDGLERLGLRVPVHPALTAHRARVQVLSGWEAIAWTHEQTHAFVRAYPPLLPPPLSP